MRRYMLQISYIISSILTSPLLILFLFSTEKKIIILDVKRWSKIVGFINTSDLINLLLLLSTKKEFRNLYYYRIKKGNLLNEIFMSFFKIFYKECPTLIITADYIGPGLFIQHGFCTIIAAKSIGENCWINQHVTIGYRD